MYQLDLVRLTSCGCRPGQFGQVVERSQMSVTEDKMEVKRYEMVVVVVVVVVVKSISIGMTT